MSNQNQYHFFKQHNDWKYTRVSNENHVESVGEGVMIGTIGVCTGRHFVLIEEQPNGDIYHITINRFKITQVTHNFVEKDSFFITDH